MDKFRQSITGDKERARFKGGFLLPPDVQKARIILAESAGEGRRSLSGLAGAALAGGDSVELRWVKGSTNWAGIWCEKRHRDCD